MSDLKRRSVQLCIMLLLVVFAGNVSGIFESKDATMVISIVYAADAQGSAQDTDILKKIEMKYYERTATWTATLTEFAQRLFRYFLMLDIVMFAVAGGIGIATGGKGLGQVLGEFVLIVILPAAFMFCVIKYYQPWSQDIIKGLYHVAGTVEPSSILGANKFFSAGIKLFDGICEAVSIKDPVTWILFLAGLVIIVVYALMAMQILLIKCESYIVLNAGIIILGLGAFSQTRHYAINFITYVLSVGIKLYVMQLIIGIAFSFVDDFLQTPVDLSNVVVVLGASIVMLGLIRVIPDMCAGIVQGQHVGSGNTLVGAAAGVAGGVMGAAAVVGGATGVASGVSSTAKAIKAVSEAADAGGHTGMGKAGFMAGAMGRAAWGAYEGGKNPESSFMGRMNSRMHSMAEESAMSRNTPEGGNAGENK